MTATAQLLPVADRPERVTTLAVAGSDKLRDRRAAFATFSTSTGERPGEEGEECCIIIIRNSRLLNEGIDVRSVDAIVFADPKSSVIDIVQAVGRALRQAYRQGKVSWVIIPVYLPAPEVGDDTATADPADITDVGGAVRAEADQEIEASSFPHQLAGPAGAGRPRRPGGGPDRRAAHPAGRGQGPGPRHLGGR
ncbi:helicase-related protein [Kitasatospora cineracea]|uniref:helicase-related protein n=1 Tax=Kitasatospora cineracea TaxID=88074 RepID=UPI00342DF327